MKKGFTLVELLTVVVIIAILSIIIIPNVLKSFNKSSENLMKDEELEVLDASKLFLQDYYYKPLSPDKKSIGNSEFKEIDANTRYLCLNSVVSNGYISEVRYKSTTLCNGIIVFNKDTDGLFTKGKTYLYCGESYTSENGETYKSYCE